MNHKNKFYLELEDCKTLSEVFNVCDKYYKIEDAELTTVSRSVVKSGIKAALNLIEPKERIL